MMIVGERISSNWHRCVVVMCLLFGGLFADIAPIQAQLPTLPGTGSVWVRRTDGRSQGEMPAFTTIGYTNYMASVDDTGGLFPAGQPWVLIFNADAFYSDERSGGGNVGFHTRRAMGAFTIGAGLSYDATQSRANNVFQQIGVTADAFIDDWSVRVNGYFPVGPSVRQTGRLTTVGPGAGNLGFVGNTVGRGTVGFQSVDMALTGGEIQLGRYLFDNQVEVYGGFYFWHSQLDGSTRGVSGGVRGGLTDRVFGEVNVSSDSFFGSNVSGGVTVYLDKEFQPNLIRSRRSLFRRVERNTQIAVREFTRVNDNFAELRDSISNAPIQLFVAQENGTGDGSQMNPSNVNSILANPQFGPGSAIVLTDANGPITSPIVLTSNGQQVLAGGDTGIVQVDFSSATGNAGDVLTLTGLGGRPVFSPAGTNALTLTNGNVIQGFTISGNGGATNGIVGNPGASDTTIADMILRNLPGNAVDIRPSVNTTISNTLFLSNGQDTVLNAENTIIRNVASSGALRDAFTIENATGNTIIENLNIISPIGDAFVLNNPSGRIQTDNLDITTPTGRGVVVNGGDANIGIDTNSSITDSGDTSFAVTDGTSSIFFGGNITQANNATTVDIQNHNSGIVTFDVGTINATNGDGLQFHNADGIYNFNGQVTLNGGDAGIDILSDSAGVFTFANTNITSVDSTSFTLKDSSASVNYWGSITQGRAFTPGVFTLGNIVVLPDPSGANATFYEFDLDGNFIQTVPFTLGRDLAFDAEGVIRTYAGPGIGFYDPVAGVSGFDPVPGLSTIGNITYGALDAYKNFVFVTDQRTGSGGEARGVLRFNTDDPTDFQRFTTLEPFDISLGRDGLLYALTRGNGFNGGGTRVNVLDPETVSLIRSFDLPIEVRAITADANGDILVAQRDSDPTVRRFDANGVELDRLDTPTFGGQTDIDLSPDGQTIIVTSTGGDYLQLDSDLNLIRRVLSEPSNNTTFSTFVKPPAGLDNLSSDNSNALVDVQNHSGGVVRFDNGTLKAESGQGLQFTNADGTYNFDSKIELSQGEAGIDIIGDSDGTFTFSDATINSDEANPFHINGGTSNVLFSGSITNTSNQAIIDIQNHTSGTVTFDTGTISTNDGTGLQFGNADGIYNFNGQVALNGGDAGIDILSDSAGTFTFANTSITDPTGTAFNVDTSPASVNYTGAISQFNNSTTVNVRNHDTGTISFLSGTISATNGDGLQFHNADGIYNFNSAVTLNGGDAGIDILADSAGTFTFANTSIVANDSTPFTVADSSANIDFTGSLFQGSSNFNPGIFTAGNFLVLSDPFGPATLLEFRTDGSLVQTSSAILNGRDLTLDSNGVIQVNLFPEIVSFNSATNSVNNTTIPGLSARAEPNFGGVDSYKNFIFIADMDDGGVNAPEGLVRVNADDLSQFVRFGNFSPTDVAVGLNGKVYGLSRGTAAISDGVRISEFDPDTLALIREFDLPAPVRAIAVDQNGHIFAAARGGNTITNIREYDSNGILLNEINTATVFEQADIDISRDGQTLVVTGLDGDVTIVDRDLTTPFSFKALNSNNTAFSTFVQAPVGVSEVLASPGKALVDIKNHTGGTVTFNGGNLTAESGTGIQLDNADGVYNFNSNVNISGADGGIDIINGSTGTVSFSNLSVSGSTDPAVRSEGGTLNINSGSIQQTAGDALWIDNTVFTLNNTLFDQIGGTVLNVGGSTLFGNGNSATNFGTLGNDRSGNTGSIDFGAVGSVP